MRLGDDNFKHIKDEHGFVMGSFKGMLYTNNCVQLSPGDAIFVYTDGVTEATASDDSLFTEERLEKVLQSTDRSDSSEAIIAAVKKSVDSFVGDAPQFDDITMLAFVYKGTVK